MDDDLRSIIDEVEAETTPEVKEPKFVGSKTPEVKAVPEDDSMTLITEIANEEVAEKEKKNKELRLELDSNKAFRADIKKRKESGELSHAQVDKLYRDRRLAQVEAKGVHYLTTTADNPITGVGYNVFSLGAGLLKTLENGINFIAPGTMSRGTEAVEMSKQVGQEISEGNKLAGALPLMFVNAPANAPKMVHAIVSGTLVGEDMYGRGESAETAVLWGGGTALGVGSVMKLVEKMGSKHVDLHKYLKEQFAITDEAENIHFAKWQQYTKGVDSPENRIKALVDNLGEEGKQLIGDVTSYNPKAAKALTEAQKGRKDVVTKKLSNAVTSGNVKGLAADLKEAQELVGKEFEQVKVIIGGTPVKPPKITIPEALDKATKPLVKSIKETLAQPEMSISDLMNIHIDLNDILKGKNGAKQVKWLEVKDEISKVIAKTLADDPASLKAWKDVNKMYSDMMIVKNSKAGIVLRRTLGSVGKKNKLTEARAIKKLSNLEEGDDLFEGVVKLIGTADATKLEKGVIKSVLGKRPQDVDWDVLVKNLQGAGFVTPEGKQLKLIIDDMDTIFPSDKYTAHLRGHTGDVGSGLGTSPWERLKVYIASKLFTASIKQLPFHDALKQSRMTDELGEVLSKPVKVKEIMAQIGQMDAGVKARIMADITSDMQGGTPASILRGEITAQHETIQRSIAKLEQNPDNIVQQAFFTKNEALAKTSGQASQPKPHIVTTKRNLMDTITSELQKWQGQGNSNEIAAQHVDNLLEARELLSKGNITALKRYIVNNIDFTFGESYGPNDYVKVLSQAKEQGKINPMLGKVLEHLNVPALVKQNIKNANTIGNKFNAAFSGRGLPLVGDSNSSITSTVSDFNNYKTIVRTTDGEAVIDVQDGIMHIDTSMLHEGSQAGSKFYYGLWDYAKANGHKTQVDIHNLSRVNQHRMTINMLKYYQETGDISMIQTSGQQWGVGMDGTVFSEPDQVAELTYGFINRLKDSIGLDNLKLESAMNIYSNAELVQYARNAGVRFSEANLNTIRNVVEKIGDGRPFALLPALVAFEEITNSITEEAK